MLRVCVVGAGAGGLCALRRLMAVQGRVQAVAFEQSDVLGGTWVYTETTGRDQNGLPVHSSMYSNLRTNLPKEVMAFPDFAFDPSLPSFVKHTDVLEYLNNYADHFKLREHVQLNTIVESVKPLENDTDTHEASTEHNAEDDSMADGLKRTKWRVRVRQLPNNDITEDVYDAVVVCNGHYSVPIMPQIPGIDMIRHLHSHDYRHAEDYAGQRVLLLGAAASGTDIAIDLATHAKEVYLSHRKAPLRTRLPENVRQVAGLVRVEEGGRGVLADGSTLSLDALMLCTGYHYSFPFLPRGLVTVDEHECVAPLYQHVLHIDHPTLSFIGIPKQICPFPVFDSQMRLIVAVLLGRAPLPSAAAMRQDARTALERHLATGSAARHSLHMGDKQWAYMKSLATIGRFQPVFPPVVQQLYEHVHNMRATDLTVYKQHQYQLNDPNHFTQVSR